VALSGREGEPVMSRLGRGALLGALALVVPLVPATVSAGGSKQGDPVKVMTIGEFKVASAGSSNPEVSGAVQARAKVINRKGGLKDASGVTHKLQVIVCNTDNDPNKADACARRAVDEKVAAVVGNFTVQGGSVYPLLEQAGIPSIGPTASEPTTLTSPVAFTLQSGIPGIFFEMPALLGDEGAQKISFVYPDLPAAAQVVPLVDLAASSAGVEVVNKVVVPLDAADLAPQVAAATANDAEGIMAVVIGDQTGRFVQGLSQAGYDGRFATASAFLTPQILSELRQQLDGAFVVLNYPPSSARSVQGVRLFNRDMNAFDRKLGKTDSAVNAWLATWVFEQVATGTDLSAGAVLAKLNQTANLETMGLTPTIDFTAPVEVQAFPLPRIFNPTVVNAKVTRGQIVSLDRPPEFVNPFE
jgi:ABC-type branched-subunit amino acid transport system substrate-binding protein